MITGPEVIFIMNVYLVWLNQVQQGTYLMDNNKTFGTEYFARLLVKYSTLLNYSLPELKKRFTDYPVLEMEHARNGNVEKLFQIRLREDELTVHCTFHDWGKCNCVYLFPERSSFVKEFMAYLRETYVYGESEGGFVTDICVVRMMQNEDSEPCFMILE